MPSIAMEAAPQPPHQKGRPGTSGAPESRFDASFNRLAHTFGIEKEGDEAAKVCRRKIASQGYLTGLFASTTLSSCAL